MIKNQRLLLDITDAASTKIMSIMNDKNNTNLKLRIYIIGGGCSGFQYKFSLDEHVQVDDFCIEKNGVILVIDPMSFQYLTGGLVDYYEGLEGSRFVILNPNAKITCSCGLSFSI